jgi:hypothetical protein
MAKHGILLLNENPNLTIGLKQDSPQTVPKKNTLSIKNLNILQKLVFGRRFDSRRLHHASPNGLRMAGHFENWDIEDQLKMYLSTGRSMPCEACKAKHGLTSTTSSGELSTELN